MLKRSLLFAALFYAACTTAPPPDDNNGGGGGGGGGGGDNLGEEVYLRECAVCHDADGTGTQDGPNITNDVPGLNAAELEDIILNGKGDMPPTENVTPEEVTALIEYLQATFQ